MKKFRKLIPALAMLLVSAVLMSTASYAWFSMNNEVTATGLEVRVTTGDNLLIAPGTTTATSKPADNTFKTTYVVGHSVTLVEPASSINGVNYYYTSTKNVSANGDAIAEEYVLYDSEDTSAFNTNYGTSGAVAYVDYAFFLKAQNADTVNAKAVNLTELKLTYGGSTQTQKAFRVAVFVNDMGATGATAATAPAAGTLKSILKVSDAGYHTSTAQAVTSATALAETTKLGTAVKVGDVPAGSTNFYKVVVRLWLEGEDTTCTNDTFATLNDNWALDVKVQFGGTAVSALNQGTTASKINLVGQSSGAEAAYTIDNVKYYEIGTSTGCYLTSASTAVGASSVVFKIVDGHPVDVTNQCTLVAP